MSALTELPIDLQRKIFEAEIQAELTIIPRDNYSAEPDPFENLKDIRTIGTGNPEVDDYM